MYREFKIKDVTGKLPRLLKINNSVRFLLLLDVLLNKSIMNNLRGDWIKKDTSGSEGKNLLDRMRNRKIVSWRCSSFCVQITEQHRYLNVILLIY